MNHKERLKEIEEDYGWQTGGPENETILYLINRVKTLTEALEKLTYHKVCDDGWYSCPKSEEGCLNESVGDECNCSASIAIKALEDVDV